MSRQPLRILITGGLGYLGGRMADHLRRARPDTVVVLGTRSIDQGPKWAEQFQIRQCDLESPDILRQAVEGVDTIVHLAALNEIDSGRHPRRALRVNTEGTFNLLEAAARSGSARVVYFSTFHVYNAAPGTPVTEASPTFSTHPYATSHRAAEDIVRYFARTKGFETLCLRLSNAVGPPMHPAVDRWTLLFNDLCRQAVTEGVLALKTSGVQTRDFIPMSDVCGAVEHLLFSNCDWGDGLYNLGSGSSTSILQAAELVAETYGRVEGTTPPIDRPGESDGQDPSPTLFSVDKLLGTGFVPSGSLEQEIEHLLIRCREWFS